VGLGVGVITSTGAAVGEGCDVGRSAGSVVAGEGVVAGVGVGVCFVAVGETVGDDVG